VSDQRGIGDNGGPPLQKFTAKHKVDRIREVLEMDITSSQKCVGIGIIVEADGDGIAAELSTKRLQTFASVSDRETVYRATKVLKEESVAEAIKVKGKPNSYRVLPPKVIDSIVDAYNQSKADIAELTSGSPVEPDMGDPVKPDGFSSSSGRLSPDMGVGSNQTGGLNHVGSDPACRPEPDRSSVQNGREGGTIGGEPRNNPTQSQLHTHTVARPAVAWAVSEDGGFEGKAFELTGLEVDGLKAAYTHLDWPGDLVAADQFFAREFDRADYWPPQMQSRLAGLHTYLNKQNKKTIEMRRAYELLAAGKGQTQRKPAKPIAPEEQPSCWFDNEGRLHVANGFKTELLATVGGDEIRLREELDKAGGWVGASVRGPQLYAKVRSRLIDQVKGKVQPSAEDRDARRTAAVRDAMAKAEAARGARRNG
jgi:Fe2+ or Zn2+ uptake regulation protein